MAHETEMAFIRSVRDKFPQVFTNARVLEIGSLNINGSIRQFFENCEYIGIDVAPGNCVDIVCQGQDFDDADESYDMTVSCECFEHNPYWVETFLNMIRMTKPGGVVTVTCATTGREEHGTSRTSPYASPLTISIGWEYYKNVAESDFREFIDLDAHFSSYEFSIHEKGCDLYFWGVKRENS